MPEITEEQLQEYEWLRSKYKQETIRASLQSVTRLEDDIDEPIKKCVMALALLGCAPLWSCCGFDYAGQPIHKTHQTGRIYFILGEPSNTLPLFRTIQVSDMPFKSQWHINATNKTATDLHLDFGNIIKQWDDGDSIHYSEQAVQIIAYFEDLLISLSDNFLSEVTLKDTNGQYKSGFPHWQYPPRQEWVIRKSDLIKG